MFLLHSFPEALNKTKYVTNLFDIPAPKGGRLTPLTLASLVPNPLAAGLFPSQMGTLSNFGWLFISKPRFQLRSSKTEISAAASPPAGPKILLTLRAG